MDRCYRHIWSNKREAPLRQMLREGTNMQDVRNHMGIRSLHLKIEKRVMERMGHVLKTPDERPTKIAVMGWFAELENGKKTPGMKRKTIIYWKKLLFMARCFKKHDITLSHYPSNTIKTNVCQLKDRRTALETKKKCNL